MFFWWLACTCEETYQSVWPPNASLCAVQLASTCDSLQVRLPGLNTLPWMLPKKLQKNTSKGTDAIFIAFGFRSRPNKTINSRCLIHKCGDVTVVFSHKVPLSIAGANQELTRLHDGTRMVFLQTDKPQILPLLPPPPPPFEHPAGKRVLSYKALSRDYNLLALVVVLVVKRSASLLRSLLKGGTIWCLVLG